MGGGTVNALAATIQLTVEDRAEIIANATRLFRGNFPPRTTPPTPRRTEPDNVVRDVSDGFRWNDLVFHRRSPVVQKTPRTGEAARDAANDAAPDPEPAPALPPWYKSYDIYVVGEKLPRKSVKGFDNRTRRSFPVRNRFTGEMEFVDPQFAPLCKSRTFGAYARLPIDTLLEPTKRQADYWNSILAADGMPQEPYGSEVVVRPGESKRKTRRRIGDDPSDDETVLVADKNGIGGDVYIYDEPEMNHDDLRLLTAHFRGATPEEVSEAGKVTLWVHQVSVDPKSLGDFTKTQQRAIERRLKNMREIDEGRCPTGTCPNDCCANPELSFADRQITHAAHLNKNLPPGLEGRDICWVELNGALRVKVLPDASTFPGATEDDRVEAAFNALVRQEMDAAEKQARKDGTSVRVARAARKAAFDSVTEIMRIMHDERGKVA